MFVWLQRWRPRADVTTGIKVHPLMPSDAVKRDDRFERGYSSPPEKPEMDPQAPASNDRLHSWKEIAAYLKRESPRCGDGKNGKACRYTATCTIGATGCTPSPRNSTGGWKRWRNTARWLRRHRDEPGRPPHFSRNRSGGGDVRRPGGGHLPSGIAARHRCSACALFSLSPLIIADAATGGDFSISRDGRRLAFVAAAADGTPAVDSAARLARCRAAGRNRGSGESVLVARRRVRRVLRATGAQKDRLRRRTRADPR